MGRPKEKRYIALDDFDFTWKESAVEEFRRLWDSDIPFTAICQLLKRSEIEVGILIMDQSEKDLIKRRKIGLGVWGFSN